jgi:arylsulfatase A-like enzyme
MLWVLIGIGPFFLFVDTYQDFLARRRPVAGDAHSRDRAYTLVRYLAPGDPIPQFRTYGVLFAQLLFLLFLEACVVRVVSLLLLRLSRDARPTAARVTAKIAIAAVFVAVAAYQACVVVSWLFFSETGRFLQPQDLYLLRFSVDLTFLKTVVTAREWLYLLVGTIVVLLSTLALFSVSGGADNEGELWHRAGLATTLLALVVGIRLILPSIAPPQLYPIVLTNASDGIAPQLSLLWSRFFYHRPEEQPRRAAQLRLEPSYSIDEYLRRASGVRIKKRNIIVIFVEAMRDDVVAAHGGDPRIMPELNRLASDGLLFTAYSQAPETSESMVSMFSSLYSHRSPQRELRSRWTFPHLFIYDLLSKIGYRTALISDEWSMDRSLLSSGHLDLHFDPLHEDLSRFPPKLNPRLHPTRAFGDFSFAVADQLKLRVLDDWISTNSTGQPFFAFLYFGSSHFPYEQPENRTPIFAPVELSSDPSFLYYDRTLAPVMRNRYFNTLHFIDGLLGELVARLKELDALKDTVLFITGDHGEAFTEHGYVAHLGYLFEESIKVPLVISGASGYEAAGEGAVQLIDISPTILSLLGLPAHGNYQGRAVVQPEGSPSRLAPATVFSSAQIFAHEDMVLVWPWKYVENGRGNEARLFDLSRDPAERDDLVTREPERRRALQRCLDHFRDSQLTYFADGSDYQSKFFPPRYQCASDVKDSSTDTFGRESSPSTPSSPPSRSPES